MPIPGFQDIMLPLLRIASDEREHILAEAIEILSHQFALTPDEKLEKLPSGRQARFTNRVGWSQTYLCKAGLCERTGRGRFKISSLGKEVLQNPPTRIDIPFLMQYSSIREFHGNTKSEQSLPMHVQEPEISPEENFESSYQSLKQALAQELLEVTRTCSPAFFERLVVDLLLAMGYGGSRLDAGAAIGQSGDGGIDGIIKEDRLGLDIIYIQAKRWKDVVGRPVVQGFAGSLEGFRARKGVFITTSTYSKEAMEYVKHIEKKIVLIDGLQLAQFMIDYNIGVAEIASYTIKRLDNDYFTEE